MISDTARLTTNPRVESWSTPIQLSSSWVATRSGERQTGRDAAAAPRSRARERGRRTFCRTGLAAAGGRSKSVRTESRAAASQPSAVNSRPARAMSPEMLNAAPEVSTLGVDAPRAVSVVDEARNRLVEHVDDRSLQTGIGAHDESGDRERDPECREHREQSLVGEAARENRPAVPCVVREHPHRLEALHPSDERRRSGLSAPYRHPIAGGRASITALRDPAFRRYPRPQSGGSA